MAHWKNALPFWQGHGHLTYGIVAMACGDLDSAESSFGATAATWSRLDSGDADIPQQFLVEVARRQAR